MLKISANDAQLTVVACGPITSDRIDLPCEITLSPEFDGLAVTVVFKAGDVQRDVAMLGSPVHVPAECLEQAGEVLMVGIWAGDGSGRPTIPTVWASAGTIRTGALPSGYDPDEPEPDWAAQVQQAAAQAVATANSVRADADAGVFDGEDGYSPTAIVEQLADGATIAITDKDGTTTATVHDGAEGRDGRDGTDGVDGFSPTATVTQTAEGATISITDKSGTTTASVSNGTDGTDGTDGVDGFSPTVDVQAITGGHEVTITDADGAHSFEVMDGDPAEPGSVTDEMLAPDGIKAQVAQLWGNQLVGNLSGTIDTASDAYAAPPMALTVEGASTQASYTGLNIWDEEWEVGSIDTTTGENITGNCVRSKNYIPVEPSTQYYMTLTTGYRFAYDENKSYIGTFNLNGTKTPANCHYVRFRMDSAYGITYKHDICLNVSGSMDGTYEPYTGGKPSPSPDYPQPILSVDDLSLCMCGVNRMHIDASTSGVTETDGVFEGSINALNDALRCPYPIPAGSAFTVDVRATATGSGNLNFIAIRADTGGKLYLASPPNTQTTWATYTYAINYPVSVIYLYHNASGTRVWQFRNLCVRADGSTAYEPYVGTTVPLYDGTLRSLPDGTKDTLNLSYLRPSTREGWAWYSREVTAHTGSTTTAATDGITGTVGVDVMSTTGEIADGPTVLYKLASAQTTTLDPIELPELPAPTCTVWCDGGSATPTYQMQYVQNTNLVIAELRAALADLATS